MIWCPHTKNVKPCSLSTQPDSYSKWIFLVENRMIRIDACKNGDKQALGELYTTYADRLLAVCRHYMKDEHVAEDALHDAFIIIFTALPYLKDEAKLEGWMTTIVKNLCLKYLQNADKDIVSLSQAAIEKQEDNDEESQEIELDTLLSAIEKLPNGSREVFKLSVLEGLSHKEIGQLLGINPHSSSSQLARAKKLLRTLLSAYWKLFLLPVLIPLYVYFVTRERNGGISEEKPVRRSLGKAHPKPTSGPSKPGTEPPRYVTPAYTDANLRHIAVKTTSKTTDICPETDSMHIAFRTDSLPKSMPKDLGSADSLLRLAPHFKDKMTALHGNMAPDIGSRRHYPWTFNLGYASNADANGAAARLNYLSVVDYANGGATAKLRSWADYEDYLTRNNALMDSVERAKLRWIAQNNAFNGGALGEKAHHHRPRTLALSVSKQLNPHWTFGTGLTYTRLKSDFESEFHRATLLKTQRISYVGIPLRLTYRLWSKGRFNAYTTGGVTFEMPVYSSIQKKYVVTADSSYTLKGNINTRCQWSLNLGIGVQYKLFRPFSFYFEPNLFYYFGNGSGLETYRTEHPLMISVPFGLRFTW